MAKWVVSVLLVESVACHIKQCVAYQDTLVDKAGHSHRVLVTVAMSRPK